MPVRRNLRRRLDKGLRRDVQREGGSASHDVQRMRGVHRRGQRDTGIGGSATRSGPGGGSTSGRSTSGSGAGGAGTAADYGSTRMEGLPETGRSGGSSGSGAGSTGRTGDTADGNTIGATGTKDVKEGQVPYHGVHGGMSIFAG
jgi:hypothetical protein